MFSKYLIFWFFIVRKYLYFKFGFPKSRTSLVRKGANLVRNKHCCTVSVGIPELTEGNVKFFSRVRPRNKFPTAKTRWVKSV